MTINYEPLREWMQTTKHTVTSIASLAGIDRSTLSRYLAAGKPLPGEVMVAWQKAFGWSPIDLAYLCLGWTPSK